MSSFKAFDIAGSGMANGGRIVHHEAEWIDDGEAEDSFVRNSASRDTSVGLCRLDFHARQHRPGLILHC